MRYQVSSPWSGHEALPHPPPCRGNLASQFHRVERLQQRDCLSHDVPEVVDAHIAKTDVPHVHPLLSHLNEILETGIATMRLRPCLIIQYLHHLRFCLHLWALRTHAGVLHTKHSKLHTNHRQLQIPGMETEKTSFSLKVQCTGSALLRV